MSALKKLPPLSKPFSLKKLGQQLDVKGNIRRKKTTTIITHF